MIVRKMTPGFVVQEFDSETGGWFPKSSSRRSGREEDRQGNAVSDGDFGIDLEGLYTAENEATRGGRPWRFRINRCLSWADCSSPWRVDALQISGQSPWTFLARHCGRLGRPGRRGQATERRSREGREPHFAAYTVQGRKLSIVTEARWSATTILLPEEY